MNRKENNILFAITSLLAEGEYDFRTAKAIAAKCGEPEAAVTAFAVEAGFDVTKKRRRDSAQLIGFGGWSLQEVEALSSISQALNDERYTYRTLANVAVEFDEEFVLRVATDAGYCATKKRRRDNAKLIGITA